MNPPINEINFDRYYKIRDILSNQKADSTKNLPKKAQKTLQGSCNYVDVAFLQWFVGFFEGDGCLMQTNCGDLMFVITQSTSDKQV
jgi:hypothetical protein